MYMCWNTISGKCIFVEVYLYVKLCESVNIKQRYSYTNVYLISALCFSGCIILQSKLWVTILYHFIYG
jgi:hypothetical protein